MLVRGCGLWKYSNTLSIVAYDCLVEVQKTRVDIEEYCSVSIKGNKIVFSPWLEAGCLYIGKNSGCTLLGLKI